MLTGKPRWLILALILLCAVAQAQEASDEAGERPAAAQGEMWKQKVALLLGGI
jgi:hypothetical protein